MIEVLVTLVVTSIVIGIISSSFPGLNRLADTFLRMTVFEEQNMIFLLKFEEEFQLAEIREESDIDQMIFHQDANLDGDFEDSGERIAYRWNSKKYRMDRKSGNGNFQALVDGVAYFDWSRISDDPLCYRMQWQSTFSEIRQTTSFCR